MTADWKKTPLERATRREDLKALRAQIKALEEKLHDALQNKKFYAERAQALAGALGESTKAARRYDALRLKGVLVDHNGEFKFLQGKDLDAFWDALDHRQHHILNESMMRQMMANVIFTSPGGQWLVSAEL